MTATTLPTGLTVEIGESLAKAGRAYNRAVQAVIDDPTLNLAEWVAHKYPQLSLLQRCNAVDAAMDVIVAMCGPLPSGYSPAVQARLAADAALDREISAALAIPGMVEAWAPRACEGMPYWENAHDPTGEAAVALRYAARNSIAPQEDEEEES